MLAESGSRTRGGLAHNLDDGYPREGPVDSSTAFHYPPELLQLLVDTIPLLGKSKRDVILFFKGAGAPPDTYSDLQARVKADRHSINWFEIARTILTRLNERGDATLKVRREVLKRVVEFEDFTRCWPDKAMEAKGLVAEVQRVVNVKDSFTRMKQERDREAAERIAQRKREADDRAAREAEFDKIKDDFFKLFTFEGRSSDRGTLLESVLNRLFKNAGILVRESFKRVSDVTGRVLEQIDGVVELDGHVYLVEMKWLSTDNVDVNDVSRHLVRVHGRPSVGGIFISHTPFTEAALETCKEALRERVVTLSLLEELVRLLERRGSLADFLRQKVRSAQLDKKPFDPYA